MKTGFIFTFVPHRASTSLSSVLCPLSSDMPTVWIPKAMQSYTGDTEDRELRTGMMIEDRIYLYFRAGPGLYLSVFCPLSPVL